jgi:hypothetical protein
MQENMTISNRFILRGMLLPGQHENNQNFLTGFSKGVNSSENCSRDPLSNERMRGTRSTGAHSGKHAG